jgi:hypothetical protein
MKKVTKAKPIKISYSTSSRLVETHQPKIITDGGPWAEHDMACPVKWREGKVAVLDIGDGVFHPSWDAQREGWMTIRPPKWLGKLLKRYERK